MDQHSTFSHDILAMPMLMFMLMLMIMTGLAGLTDIDSWLIGNMLCERCCRKLPERHGRTAVEGRSMVLVLAS